MVRWSSICCIYCFVEDCSGHRVFALGNGKASNLSLKCILIYQALLPALINASSPLEKSRKCICLSEEVCSHRQYSGSRGYIWVVIGSATLILNSSDLRPESFALSI